jgi:predicted RNA-binding Zn-ribbon protein involved in translation (DUF1610 family)
MVTDADFEHAKEILRVQESENEVRQCPNCGSSEIQFGMKGKHRLGERVLIFFSLIFGIPMGNVKNKYYCKNCGHDFQ